MILPRLSFLRSPRSTRGFTLLEVMIALVVLSIGFLGLGSVFVANARSYDYASEETLVIHCLRETAEKLRGAPFNQLVSNYQGYSFVVGGMSGVVTVTIFLDETDASPEAKKLGLPRDLDGDGLVSNKNISAAYVLLPIKIEIAWTNQQGPQLQSVYMFLAQETN